MKVAPLLAQYLYANKRLDLPGLGSFFLDPQIPIVADNGKQIKAANLEGVSFESNTAIKEVNDLVRFISSQTGTMKALAAADLDSYLGLALQFLNIGKPFLFEGIGTLTKIKSGEFAFTPGYAIPAFVKEQSTTETISASPSDESLSDYKSIFYNRKKNGTWKKPMTVLLLVAGLALAILGGYIVYKKNKDNKENTPDIEIKPNETVLVTDTTQLQKNISIKTDNVIPAPAGSYKFILEISDAKRAFARLGKLKTFQWPVQMETKDSLSFKIFMLLPLNTSDTSRVLDSLFRLNGKRVYIEQ